MSDLITNEQAQNKPLTQADLNEMHFERVWIQYPDENGEKGCGEDGVVLYGKLFSIDALEKAGFKDWLEEYMPGGETLDHPSGIYTLYRQRQPQDKPLTQSDLNEMHFERVWIQFPDIDGEEQGGDDGVVLYGELFSIEVLDGAGFDDLLLDFRELQIETLGHPTYTLYRQRQPQETMNLKSERLEG